METNDDTAKSIVEDLDLDAYRQSLSELVFNSKPHIVMLTMLAEESKDTKAAEIVDCIEERLYQVNKEVKLPTLYLIDSICKNVQNSSYIQLFQKKIIKLFCHTFEKADEKTRILMFKLRQTWNNYFTQEVLYNLDLAVKKIDSAWPVASKKNSPSTNGQMQSRETVKPVVIPVIKSQIISTTPPGSKPIMSSVELAIKNNDKDTKKMGTAHPTIILLNQSEIISKRNQIEQELRQELISKSKESSLNKNSILNHNKAEQSNNKRKKESKESSKISSSKKEQKHLNDHKVSSPKDITKNDSPIKKIKIPKRKRASSPSNHPSKHSKKNQDDVAITIVAPDDVIPLGRNHHVSVTKRAKEIRIPRNDNVLKIKNIKNRRSPANRRRSPSSSDVRNRISPSKPILSLDNNTKKGVSTTATTIPAPNVFVQPEVLFPFSNTMENNSPQQQSNQSPNFCMDRDYRREFETIMKDAQKQLNDGTISSADHEILVREAERQFFELQNQPNVIQKVSTVQPSSAQQPYPPPATSNSQFISSLIPPIATSSNTMINNSLIEPPHGSAFIYINKQFCRLFYLDHITAIVPFKANTEIPFDYLVSIDPVFLEPKQVYFSGHPIQVIIDPGTPNEKSLCLKFNNPLPYAFSLPGVHTPQRIMLGLPDRELIVNDRPYKAQFGGPPVSVFIECDQQNHLFLLSGSQPFLQVSEEPRYDLWNRLVAEAKATIPNTQSTNPPFNYETNVLTPAVPSTSYINPPQSNVVNPIVSTNSLPSFDSKPIPDLNSLLSKLTAVGLINNKTATASSSSSSPSPSPSSSANPKSDFPKVKTALLEKRYLPLEMPQLKKYHQFVIDQLYIGLQCTNCSLRFPDESLKDDSGKKSRYSRHLDWHFRQNRREKAKPQFGSAVIAHRRPWYYTIDQWILYKEVNDDIEEDNNAFFDSNTTDSPNGNNKTTFNLNLSAFKDSITDFDLFIETISCDNIKINGKEKICSVVADSDVTSNCTVCNEPFDLRWFEDEEEWRLMNAVCYKSDDVPNGRNYHPLCLKDYLLQQLDKEERSLNSELEESNNLSTNLSEVNRIAAIPGLDTPLKDDINIKSEPSSDVETGESTEIATIKDGESKEQNSEDKNKLDENKVESSEKFETENFVLNVEEFEIPLLSHESQQTETVDDNNKNPKSDSCEIQNNSQPKRGIVLKMKRSIVSSNINSVENGNVLACNESNSSRDATTMDEPEMAQNADEQIDANDDDKQNNNDDDDSNNKGMNIVDVHDNTPSSSSSTEPIDSQVDDDDNNNTINVSESEQRFNVVGNNGDNCRNHDESESGKDDTEIQNEGKDQSNYYTRGHEISALCTIM